MGKINIAAIATALLIYTTSVCVAYPTGAPLQACEEMRPYHPPTTTTGSPPFAINISTNAYKPGSEIKGTIYSPSGVLFRGFLIEARHADGSDNSLLGTFIVVTEKTHTNCGVDNKQGLTHTTNNNKTKVDFIWQAPAQSTGDIHFKMTVVESYNVSRYWLGIYSDVITDCQLNHTAECDDITTQAPVTTETPMTNPGTRPSETTAVVTTETSTKPHITTPSNNKIIKDDPACGKTKGCFPDCSGGCEYLVTWERDSNVNDDEETVHFELQMILDATDNVWAAIGISPTGKMDDTNVIACLSETTGVTLEASHNEGYTNVLYSKKSLGLSNMLGSVSDGKITCSFSRLKSMNETDFVNLDDKMYLLVGTGPIVNGVKRQHEKIPVRSSDKVNFMATGVSKEADSATTLIKIHGSFMVLAWVLLSSIGVVVARHFKSMMHGRLMCDVAYWFSIHRTLMFGVLLCVIVAFVAIFYEVGGFSKIGAEVGKEYTKAHPYMGIAVTALTLLNPILALFRPSPNHENRPIFNWIHFSIGMLAHITAVVTIYFGINLDKAKVNGFAKLIMIGYSAFFVVIESILEIHRRSSKSASMSYSKVNSNSIKQAKLNEPSMFRTMVLLLHVIVMTAVTVLLILMICVPSQFPEKS